MTPIEAGQCYLAKRRLRKAACSMLAVAGLASVATVVGLTKATDTKGASAQAQTTALAECTVVDGDTLRCRGERIRLLGIDAPEMPGHCREGRACAAGDPYASTSSLREAIRGKLRVERLGQDGYGRTLAMVAGKRATFPAGSYAVGRPSTNRSGMMTAV